MTGHEGVRQPSTSTFPMTASPTQSQRRSRASGSKSLFRTLTGWWLGERLDGEAYRHYRAVGVIALLTAASYWVTATALGRQMEAIQHVGQLNVLCFEFLGWWWVVYFVSRNERLEIFTLRRFLDGASSARRTDIRLQHSRLAISGGVSYGYAAYATFGVFVLMCLSSFVPILGGYGTALYVFLAYPYLFGYYRPAANESPDTQEIDKGANTVDRDDSVLSHAGKTLETKATSSIQIQGILIAVVILLLTITVLWDPGRSASSPLISLNSYRRFIEPVIFVLAMISLVCWMLSMDILDTALNAFSKDHRNPKFDFERYYFRWMGPIGLRTRTERVSSDSTVPTHVGSDEQILKFKPKWERDVRPDLQDRLFPDLWTGWPSLVLGALFFAASLLVQLRAWPFAS